MEEGKQWCEKMQRHMYQKMEKARMHDIWVIDGLRRKHGIRLQQKYINSYARRERKQACTLGDVATCTCNKPKLLHKPCSHVYKACANEANVYAIHLRVLRHAAPFRYMEFKVSLVRLDMNYKDLWPDKVQ